MGNGMRDSESEGEREKWEEREKKRLRFINLIITSGKTQTGR